MISARKLTDAQLIERIRVERALSAMEYEEARPEPLDFSRMALIVEFTRRNLDIDLLEPGTQT